jgi:hypothetical protein
MDVGSRGEEWMNIQNEKILEYTAGWKRLCSVTHSSGKLLKKEKEDGR